MTKKILFSLLVFLFVGLIVAGLILTKGAQFAAMDAAGQQGGPPPTAVATFTAERQTWERSLRAVGSIEPVQGVLLEAEAPGLVESINFTNGEVVTKGDLLVQLDITVEQAQLRSARASAKLAETEFERSRTLRESGNVPQSQLDRAEADLERARAEVENIRAVIDRKTIRAPFTGQVGIRRVNLGQYVAQGAPIVALQAYETVFVNFSLPQQSLDKIGTGMTVELRTDVFPDRVFSGAITAVSPQVDPVTRSVDVQGTLENGDGALRAGLFVNVRVLLPEKDEVVVVPTTAIVYAPYGDSIYKIEAAAEGAGQVARQAFIRIGERRGDFVSVVEGLAPGEPVVAAGAFKLRNGAPILINNENTPRPERNPTPDNS